jgi:hypothetical protein
VNEGRTTAIFAAVAAVSFGLAWISRPESITDESDLKRERTGQPVFAKFENPDEAISFQVIKYDDELGQLERFEVAKDKQSGMWKLPSFDDYPADAAEQVRDATTPLISMPILDVPSLDRGDHALYGVVNPDEEGLTVGETGVGMLVRVKDKSDQMLADLIIGKEVDGAENQRYVRIPTEDAVYVVELNTTPFTTEFSKWINQELLGVRSFDITDIGLRDYAIVPTQGGSYGMSRNFDADLDYDTSASQWNLEKFTSYESGKAVDVTLEEDQELNSQALNDLRTAIQDLQIVNVLRKPKGLAADLKADKSLMENQESLQSLVSQGFIPQESPTGTEIFATGGETLVGTEDGVKYLLRFGESVANLGAQTEGDEDSLRRYLLVSATLDTDKFPAPDLEPLPETVEEMLAREQSENAPEETPSQTQAESTDATAESTQSSEATPSNNEDAAPAEAPASDNEAAPTPAEPSPEPADAGTQEPAAADGEAADADPSQSNEEAPAPNDEEPDNSEEELNDCGPQETEPTESPAESPTASDAPESPTEQAPASEQAPTADSPAENGAAEAAPPAETQPVVETAEELQERLEAVREQIAKENQRKIDERNERMDAGRKKVQELNARFADWYYVVSDSVYRKLKISRDELIKAKGEGDSSAAPSGMPQLPPGLPPGLNFQQ